MTLPALSNSSVHPGGVAVPQEGPPSASPFHILARVLLLATLCGAPWAYGAVQPWAWATLTVLSLLVLVLWAVGCAQRGLLKVSWSPLFWPFLGFLLLALVQLFAGLTADRVATREAVLKLVANLVLFFLAGQLLSAQPENGRTLEWLGLVVTLLAFALCALGVAQILTPGKERMIYWTFPVSGWPFGPYVNHNNYAGLMEMLLPISVAYILYRVKNAILRALLWSGVMGVILSVWMGGSRGATIVLLIEGALWAALLLRYQRGGFSPRLIGVLAGVVLVAAVGFTWLARTGRGARALTVFETNQSVEAKLGHRLGVGIDTLHMAASHPWSGVGVGTFEYVFPRYLTFPMDLRWTHAHDDVLEGIGETGLPGAVLIVLAVVLFFRTAFRHLERRWRHGWGWIQIGAAVGAVGMLCHSFVDFNLRVPANAAWFVVLVAIATSPLPPPGRLRRMVNEWSVHRSGEFLT